MQILKESIAGAIRTLIMARHGEAPERIVVEYPPRSGMGDLASPIAFELARRLRKAPRAIAAELASALPLPAGVVRVEAGGAGYLNFFLDRPVIVGRLAREFETAPAVKPDGGKIIIEHTNINPNKAAHIGHLRNAVLGDSLARSLRLL